MTATFVSAVVVSHDRNMQSSIGPPVVALTQDSIRRRQTRERGPNIHVTLRRVAEEPRRIDRVLGAESDHKDTRRLSGSTTASSGAVEVPRSPREQRVGFVAATVRPDATGTSPTRIGASPARAAVRPATLSRDSRLRITEVAPRR
jgi:hypothetical protein